MNPAPVFPGSRLPAPPAPAVRVLLTVNIVSFLVGKLAGEGAYFSLFGLSVPEVFVGFRIYQFVTYLFVHGNAFHLFFNMLILYIFGRELEIYWGTRRFLRYYFVSGIGAGIISIPFMWGAGMPLVGASGALFALLIAFGMLFPERVVTLLLFFFIPVRLRARQMVMIFIGLELLFLLGRGGGGGIAHFAHLGGALVGFIYLKWPDWRTRSGRRTPPSPPQISYREELDLILDKLAREGWGGLSEGEKDFLHDARYQL
jgi:membrane associated rhomboid family serine protease